MGKELFFFLERGFEKLLYFGRVQDVFAEFYFVYFLLE
jgi:hypothetical protein